MLVMSCTPPNDRSSYLSVLGGYLLALFGIFFPFLDASGILLIFMVIISCCQPYVNGGPGGTRTHGVVLPKRIKSPPPSPLGTPAHVVHLDQRHRSGLPSGTTRYLRRLLILLSSIW